MWDVCVTRKPSDGSLLPICALSREIPLTIHPGGLLKHMMETKPTSSPSVQFPPLALWGAISTRYLSCCDCSSTLDASDDCSSFWHIMAWIFLLPWQPGWFFHSLCLVSAANLILFSGSNSCVEQPCVTGKEMMQHLSWVLIRPKRCADFFLNTRRTCLCPWLGYFLLSWLWIRSEAVSVLCCHTLCLFVCKHSTAAIWALSSWKKVRILI